MELNDVVRELKLEIISGYEGQKKEVEGVYISDLLSIVMSKAKENNIWITIQTHLNIIAVATLVGISAIIIAENMKIDEDTVLKSKELKLPLFRSNLTSYELACKLNGLGI